MQVNLSPEIGHLTDEAVQLSASQGDHFVGVEHLFHVLTINLSLLPRNVRELHGESLTEIQRVASSHGWGGRPPAEVNMHYTPRAGAALAEAGRIANELRCGQANAGHLLFALLEDEYALPSRLMLQYGVDRDQVCADLRDGLTRNAGMNSRAPYVPSDDDDVPESERATRAIARDGSAEDGAPDIQSFLRDLTEDARSGSISPALGRDHETVELLQILTRHGKNNAILVGEPGVGKTKIVEALACRCHEDAYREVLADKRILELNLAAMMSGTKYRGELEDKLVALIKSLESDPNVILFIDEIHLIMGAGGTDDSSMDIANILKPALARGVLRVVGATTSDEYQRFLAKDAAIERRFQVIRVQALDPKTTLTILEELRAHLQVHHSIRVPTETLKAAIELSEHHLPNRQLPDKAIDVLDQACSRCRLKVVLARSDPKMLENTVMPADPEVVTVRDVERVIEDITGAQLVDRDDQKALTPEQLGKYLSQAVVGQSIAVKRLVSAMQRSEAGLANPDKPRAVMFFVGPSGVGKSQMAKRFARAYKSSKDRFTIFDMTEYTDAQTVSNLIGAPKGYAGSDQDGALVRAVRTHPDCVLLFDEIEKAHQSIFDVLLPVLDDGRLTDTHGKLVNFNDCVFIFTSNAAAELLTHARSRIEDGELRKYLEKIFRPEFVNRVDEIVPFYSLRKRHVARILRLLIDEVRYRLKRKKIGIRMYQEAYLLLAETGYSREYGARELRRAVDRLILTPIAEAVLKREFVEGDMIDVMREGDRIVLAKGKPHVPKTSAPRRGAREKTRA